MIKSMTGFGRGAYEEDGFSVIAEIRAVNHRYSEIGVRMPRRYSFAEEALKALVKSAAPRGKIELSVIVDSASPSTADVRLDKELAGRYLESFMALKEAYPQLAGEPSLHVIAGMPDVLRAAAAEEDEELVTRILSEAVRLATDGLDAMRRTEGEKLAADILMRNELIENTAKEIEGYSPQVVRNYVEKLRQRISELMGDAAVVSEDRILLEAAVFADKSNITEELVRLKSHCQQLKGMVKSAGEPVGKKLDFLVQEMNREANTIGSKANDISITKYVLVLKSEIEKIREQVQNIE